MSKKISLSVFIFALLAALLVSFLGAFVVVSQLYDAELREAYASADSPNVISDGRFEELKFLDSLFKVYAYNNDEISDEAVIDAVLKAYATSTGDKYAEYYTEEEFDSLNADNSGEMQGIGINIIQNTEYNCIEVINVMPDSPALEAGILPGDLIVYVGIGEEKESVAALGYINSVARLQGLAGTKAEFVVNRGENYSETVEYSITRGYVQTQSVNYRICATDPTVGIVRILEFDLTTPTQFCQAVDALTAQGIDDIVFDVRNNPGGDLRSIVSVLSYFLNAGDPIISTLDNAGNKEVFVTEVCIFSGDYAGCSVAASDIGKYKHLNCVVLVNENTASAAELFTANFRDYEIGTVVGVTTYGKGSMQNIISLDQFGFEGGVRLTTKMYFPPCEEGYDGIGITPDVEVELSEEASKINIYKITDAEDNQLQRAIQELK